MRNFGKLGFKNYLDSYDDPSVWNSKRLIVQLDSLMQVLNKNDKYLIEGKFQLKYDMIILDESESLVAHFDETTMQKMEIGIWDFFHTLLNHCGKMLLMDGDMSPRSLSFAKNYGDITYINNKNTEGKKVINLMLCEEQWKEQLRADLTKFYEEDPSFRVCIASQSASKIDALYTEIKEQLPHWGSELTNEEHLACRRNRRITWGVNGEDRHGAWVANDVAHMLITTGALHRRSTPLHVRRLHYQVRSDNDLVEFARL